MGDGVRIGRSLIGLSAGPSGAIHIEEEENTYRRWSMAPSGHFSRREDSTSFQNATHCFLEKTWNTAVMTSRWKGSVNAKRHLYMHGALQKKDKSRCPSHTRRALSLVSTIRRKDEGSSTLIRTTRDTAYGNSGHAVEPAHANICKTARLQVSKTAGTEGDNEAVYCRRLRRTGTHHSPFERSAFLRSKVTASDSADLRHRDTT